MVSGPGLLNLDEARKLPGDLVKNADPDSLELDLGFCRNGSWVMLIQTQEQGISLRWVSMTKSSSTPKDNFKSSK